MVHAFLLIVSGCQPHNPDPVSNRIQGRVPWRGRNVELERGQKPRRGDRRVRGFGGIFHLHQRRSH